MKYKPTKTKIKVVETIYNDGTKKIEYIPMFMIKSCIYYEKDIVVLLSLPITDLFNRWKYFQNKLEGGELIFHSMDLAKKHIDDFLSEEKRIAEKRWLIQAKSIKKSYIKYP